MAQKIQVTLDATKLRTLVSQRKYTNQQGQDVILQEVKFDLVEMKPESQKTVYEGEKHSLVKTHFAVAQQTKEERDANTPAIFIGDGITLVWKNESTTVHNAEPITGNKKEDVPF